MFIDLFIARITTVLQPHLLPPLLSHVLIVISRHIHQNKVIPITPLHRLAIHTDPIYSNGWKLPPAIPSTLIMAVESLQLLVMVPSEVGEAVVQVQLEIGLLSSASQLLTTTTNTCPLPVVSKVPRLAMDLAIDTELHSKCK
jgi:hypothetical protein